LLVLFRGMWIDKGCKVDKIKEDGFGVKEIIYTIKKTNRSS
jgi:hypothetical protein